jgi:anti-sigma regulatory factor (Ser/Thr protein kinase)
MNPAAIDRRMENSPGRIPADLELSLPATMEGLDAALNAIEQYCVEKDRDLVSRVRIVVEELFSNTIKYGYGRACARPVRLHLAQIPVLTLTYGDDAPPFDPTGWKSQEIEELLPDRRAEGRAGIAMIKGLCATVRYAPQDGRNRLVLTFTPETKSKK